MRSLQKLICDVDSIIPGISAEDLDEASLLNLATSIAGHLDLAGLLDLRSAVDAHIAARLARV